MITVRVLLGAGHYRDFAVYDLFYRLRKWVRPAIFTGVLFLGFLVSFFLRNRSDQAAIVWGALLVFTFLVPIIYALYFYRTIRQGCSEMKLGRPKFAYELVFEDGSESFSAETTGGKIAHYQWETVYAVSKTKKGIYIYVSQDKVFILPNNSMPDGSGQLWSIIKTSIPVDRILEKK